MKKERILESQEGRRINVKSRTMGIYNRHYFPYELYKSCLTTETKMIIPWILKLLIFIIKKKKTLAWKRGIHPSL